MRNRRLNLMGPGSYASLPVLRSRKLSTTWMAFVMGEYIRSGRGWSGESPVRRRRCKWVQRLSGHHRLPLYLDSGLISIRSRAKYSGRPATRAAEVDRRAKGEENLG